MKQFISKEEWLEIVKSEDETLINEILSRVYNSAIEAAIKKLPEVVTRMVANTTATKAMKKDFFKRNVGFSDHKEIVIAVVQEVEVLHPEWGYDAILRESEPIIKEKIGAVGRAKGLPLNMPNEVNLKGNGVLS